MNLYFCFQAMPILQSFCIYSAICIFLMYMFVITFFVAVFTLDEKRVMENRNGFIPCIKHDDKSSQLCMDKNLMQQFLTLVYTKFILTNVGKVSQKSLFYIKITSSKVNFLFFIKGNNNNRNNSFYCHKFYGATRT